MLWQFYHFFSQKYNFTYILFFIEAVPKVVKSILPFEKKNVLFIHCAIVNMCLHNWHCSTLDILREKIYMAPSTGFLNYKKYSRRCRLLNYDRISTATFQIRIPVEKAADVLWLAVFFLVFILLWLLLKKYSKIKEKWILLYLESHIELILILLSTFNLQPRRYFRLQACSRERWWELLLLGQERSWHKRWTFSDLWCLVSSPHCHHRWDQNYFLRGNWGRGSDQNLSKCVGEHPCIKVQRTDLMCHVISIRLILC